MGKVLSTAAKIFVREEPDLVTRAREKEGAFGVTKATSNAAMIFLREEPEYLARR